MRLRPRACGATAAVAIFALSAPAVGQTSPADGWAQVLACASHADPAARHACLDSVLRAVGALDPVAEVAAQREAFGRTEQPAPPPPAVARAAEAPRVPAPPPRVAAIATTIAGARLTGEGRLLVATSEGAVWRQIDGAQIALAPQAGTPFEVREAALGSFRCTVGQSASYRCERVN